MSRSAFFRPTSGSSKFRPTPTHHGYTPRTQARTGRRTTWAAQGDYLYRPLNDTYPVPEAPQSRVAL
eukprot:897598-Prymnesium_polylepis.1